MVCPRPPRRVVAAYGVALARAVAAARALLRAHAGYECKEPEPGKLTVRAKVARMLRCRFRALRCPGLNRIHPQPPPLLQVAFNSLEEAVRWAAALQRALLEVDWPPEVLTWRECREVLDGEEDEEEDDDDEMQDATEALDGRSEGGSERGGGVNAGVNAAAAPGAALLWRGLRVRAGIAAGALTSKAPLNTGRADYFGAMPNLAARLMALAAPGQSLVDGARLSTLRTLSWRAGAGLLPGSAAAPEAVELTPLGQFAGAPRAAASPQKRENEKKVGVGV